MVNPGGNPGRGDASTQFQIRMLSQIGDSASVPSVGAGAPGLTVGLSAAAFEILEMVSRASSIYRFIGSGGSIGPNLPTWIPSQSGTITGEWNRFQTPSPLQVTEFEGLLEIDTLSSFPARDTNLTSFFLHPRAIWGHIYIWNFKTGPGLSLSAGIRVMKGILTRMW